MPHDLAIVIPAFKGRHLSSALASLAAQTDRRFTVYVGDDASPEPIEAIVSASPLAGNGLVYHRFRSNEGGTSLVRQWDRCIRLSGEPWVWLFSDDDLMDPECVARFHQALEQTGGRYDFYRFNATVIDGAGRCVAMCPTHPEWEPAREYAYYFLRGVRRITQQEAVFRRETYESLGGIPDLPLAWYSDSAFAIASGRNKGLFTIAGSRVQFRLSGENISSRRGPERDRMKWEALLRYVAWLKEFIADTSSDRDPPTDSMLLTALHERFMRGIRAPRRWMRVGEILRFSRFLRLHFPDSCRKDTVRLLKYNLSVFP